LAGASPAAQPARDLPQAVFERLPYLSTADDYQSMLPWNIKRESQL
jgi:hypothetical protein